MSALIIANPAANRAGNRNILSDLQTRSAQLAGAQWTQTTHPRHAVALAETAHSHGFDRVIAVGGDGTVHEVVNGLMRVPPQLRPALGVVPVGTGNDFALGAGLYTKNAVEAWQRATSSANRKTMDAARVSDEHGRQEYWDNTLGIGFDAAANMQARKFRRLRGFPMYFLSVVRTIIEDFDPVHMDMKLDEKAVSAEVLMLAVGNGGREGGGFQIAPGARMDDGVLDVAQVDRLTRTQMFGLLPKFMNGTQLTSPHVHMHQCTSIQVRLDRALPIHVDGEIFSTNDSRNLRIECLPGALNVVI